MDIGVFHPITVHFPVSLLTIALALDALRIFTKFRPFFIVAHWTVLVGTILLFPTIMTGLSASSSMDPSDKYVLLHRNFALITLCISISNSLLRIYALNRYYSQKPRKIDSGWFLLASTINMILVTVTGDLGGFLTHGRTPFFAQDAVDMKEKIEKDPYHVRLFPPDKLKGYLQEQISLDQVILIFEKHSCRDCHIDQFAEANLAGFSTVNGKEDIWLPRNEDGSLLNWEESSFYQEVILKNKMPMDENDKTIGMPESERLVLLQWVLNGAPLEAKKEEVKEEVNGEEGDDWLE